MVGFLELELELREFTWCFPCVLQWFDDMVRTTHVRFILHDLFVFNLIFVSAGLFVTLTDLPLSYREDEDVPFPLTCHLSTLNLARYSSAPSVLTTGNTTSRRFPQQHPLSRSNSCS